MTDVAFQVVDARPERYAAVPTLRCVLRVDEATGAAVQSIALRCQIRIEPQRRRYSEREAERLLDLFGESPRWGDTLKPFLWTHVAMMVPGFSGSAEVELHVPCTYDLEVTASKYFHSLDDGEVPLLFLFSGTIFAKSGGALQLSQVPWHEDATYRLPVRVWRELMDLYFPNSGWLRLQRETLDALLLFKSRRALATWDEAVDALLKQAGESAA